MRYLALLLVVSLCLCCLTGCGIIGDLVSGFVTSQETQEVTEEIIESFPEPQNPELGTPEPEPEPTDPEIEQPTPIQPDPVPPQDPQPPTAPAQPVDVEAAVTQIRAWYQSIVSDTNLETHHFGDAATVYLQNGQIASVAEYRQLNDAVDPAMATVHFYYHNSEPFFVFIQYSNAQYDEVRLYFADGELIRWIIDQNAPNDNIPNPEWQDYYNQAVSALSSAHQALG